MWGWTMKEELATTVSEKEYRRMSQALPSLDPKLRDIAGRLLAIARETGRVTG